MRVCLSVWPQTHKGPHQADITLPCLAPPRPAVDPLSVGVILFIALFSSSWFLLGIDASCVCREASPPCPAPPQCYLTTRQLCTGWTPTAVTPLPQLAILYCLVLLWGSTPPTPPAMACREQQALVSCWPPPPTPPAHFLGHQIFPSIKFIYIFICLSFLFKYFVYSPPLLPLKLMLLLLLPPLPLPQCVGAAGRGGAPCKYC